MCPLVFRAVGASCVRSFDRCNFNLPQLLVDMLRMKNKSRSRCSPSSISSMDVRVALNSFFVILNRKIRALKVLELLRVQHLLALHAPIAIAGPN